MNEVNSYGCMIVYIVLTSNILLLKQEEQSNLRKLLVEGVNENRISGNSSGYGFGLAVSNKIAFKLNEEINKGKS